MKDPAMVMTAQATQITVIKPAAIANAGRKSWMTACASDPNPAVTAGRDSGRMVVFMRRSPCRCHARPTEPGRPAAGQREWLAGERLRYPARGADHSAECPR